MANSSGGAGEKFLTARQLALVLGVHRRTIYRLVQKKQLTAYSVGGALRFHKNDVEAFLKRSQVGGTGKGGQE